MDNYYSHLLSRIQQIEVLNDAIRNISKDSEINLVTSDWISRLENNIDFQDYSFRANTQRTSLTTHYDWEASKDPPFNVIIAGSCRFAKPYNVRDSRSYIILNNSEPLLKIAQRMTSDLGEINISNEFKFSLKECGPLGCDACNSSNKTFLEKGFKLSKSNQPCICDTKIFNGKKVVNRFQSQMEDLFKQSPFIAIVRLEIYTRYSYFDKQTNMKIYRIGGDLTDIIAFQECKLNTSKIINLGELTLVEKQEEKEEDVILIPEELPEVPEKLYLESLDKPEDETLNEGPIRKKPKVELFSFTM